MYKDIENILKELGMTDTYIVCSSSMLSNSKIFSYFCELDLTDGLKERFCDEYNPSPLAMVAYVNEGPDLNYFVLDCHTQEIVAEFALCNPTGRAIQVHMSMLPANSYELNITLARKVSNMILSCWKDKSGKAIYKAIFGLTPTINRKACIFVLKAGYKKMGILPSGVVYKGGHSDAMLSLLTLQET